MTSSIEGACTVKIDEVSDLVKHDEQNSVLFREKSYEGGYIATYGPFPVGQYKCNVIVLPVYGGLYFYLCFLDNNAEAFNKYGTILHVQDHSSNGGWAILGSTKPNEEKPFNYSEDFLRASGLPVTNAISDSNQNMQKYVKDDCLVLKFLVWVLLDDSKVGPSKSNPVPQPDPKTSNQPNCPSPDFISELLTGQFSDIHFTVEEQVFTAHTVILAARSSVFRSQFFPQQDETCRKKLHVSVQEMDALTFQYLLHYIYTNSLPSDFEATSKRYELLFLAAYHFKVEGLRLICEEKLTKAITDTIVRTLERMHCGKELGLLKIVSKDCNMKAETTTDEE